MNRASLFAGLAGGLAGGAAVAFLLTSGLLGGDKARTERIVHNYVLSHPEIIPEAMQRLQQGELAKGIEANRAAFETPFASAWAGAPDADVVLVEFFDYACGFCRKSNPDIQRLLAEDKKLKVVWREFPVLGEDSLAAAQASLAAARQGKFRQFHDALFASARPTPDAIAAAQKAAGVSPQPGSPDFRSELEKNYQLATLVRATGTPQFVIGDQALQGAVGYEALKASIAAARARR